MKDPSQVVIAVAGHANSGKTTLVRTLLKREVGEVADRPDETKEASRYAARFGYIVDCPGLQNAQALLLSEESDVFRNQLKEHVRANCALDVKALDAIEGAHVTLYVCTLESVPGTAHRDEILLVKRKCPRIIGVLNQYNATARGKSVTDANGRIQAWRELLTSNGVDKVITFDAHWDMPAKVREIYESIKALLPSEMKAAYEEDLLEFRELLRDAKSRGFDLIADLVLKSRSIHQKDDSQNFAYDSAGALAEVAQRVRDDTNDLQSSTVFGVSTLNHSIHAI